MSCQVQQMKSSIANIKQKVCRLSHQDTIKHNTQNILPQSIIHTHPTQLPCPSPKITKSIPNITRTQVFTPARHHLDDTEMKKVMEYHECKRENSNTVKTKYIYDGGRVIYVPPVQKQKNDNGHLVIKPDYHYREYSDSNPQNYNSDYYSKPSQQGYVYSMTSNQKNRRKLQDKDILLIDNQKYNKRYNTSSRNGRQYKNRAMISDSDTQQKQKQRYNRYQKSIKIQCNIKNTKNKQPFIINWDPNTDDQFSDLDIDNGNII